MKTQRRHELQQNELADHLAKWLEQVKPYSKLIVGVAVVIAAVLFAVVFISNSSRRTNEAGWTAYYAAQRALPEDVRRRLVHLSGRRMTSDGILVIDARRHRSQKQNRQDALDRLQGLLQAAAQPARTRRPSKPSAASRSTRSSRPTPARDR